MRQEAANQESLAVADRRRSSRVFAALLAASAVAHAAAIAWLPAFSDDAAPARASVLVVTVMKPEPVVERASVPEPAPAPRRAAPRRKAAPPDTRRDRGETVPLLALSKSEPDVMATFPVAPAEPAEQVPRQTIAPPATEIAAATPPSIAAAYLSSPAPQYPSASRRAGEQGTVLLRVLVKRDGLPMRVEIEKSSGSAHLDAAARDAVWGWRFRPARRGTETVESWIGVPVVFRLEGPG